MTWDFVYLLPIVAIAIGVFYPLRIVGSLSGTSLMDSKGRWVILRRLALFVLPLSTIIAVMNPSYELSNLIKALLISFAVLVPVYLAHLCLSALVNCHRFLLWSRAKARSGAGSIVAVCNPQSDKAQVHIKPTNTRIRRSVARSISNKNLASILAAHNSENNPNQLA